MKPYFHLFRGIPGTGKSTAAKNLQKIFTDSGVKCDHYEADMFFMFNGSYDFNPSKLGAAHAWCLNSTKQSLQQKTATLVSNTFTAWREVNPYIELSRELKVDVLITSLTVEYGSVHQVPVEAMDKMRQRFISQHQLAMDIDDHLRKKMKSEEFCIHIDTSNHIHIEML